MPANERYCLVVEDSPIMRQLLVFALSRIAGLTVTEADDGAKALKSLATRQFDLVITDINMPVLDGLKVVHRVRMDPRHRDTPIIVITTDKRVEDRDKAMALGANDYITKPIQAPVVVSTVKRLLALAS
jgi:two-component system, chemotaxis family, chemotaxis protein CheY